MHFETFWVAFATPPFKLTSFFLPPPPSSSISLLTPAPTPPLPTLSRSTHTRHVCRRVLCVRTVCLCWYTWSAPFGCTVPRSRTQRACGPRAGLAQEVVRDGAPAPAECHEIAVGPKLQNGVGTRNRPLEGAPGRGLVGLQRVDPAPRRLAARVQYCGAGRGRRTHGPTRSGRS